jgi:hypothetical protein
MPQTDIDSAVASDLANVMDDYSVEPKTTDGAGSQKETFYITKTWEESLGYYKSIPEFKTAVDAKATWTIGAGFESDEVTSMLLANIKGNGKESFNTILKNMIKVKTIDKDAYSEIIRDKNGVLINLKPLDPSTIRIYQNSKGMITKYAQVSKVMKTARIFKPSQIFHLSHDRIADEIHGVRILDSLKWLIDARNEAMTDYKKLLHRNIQPVWIIHLDTDDTTEINAYKTKYDNARRDGENMYVPKGVVVPELAAVPSNATLNPLNWINQLNDYFFQAVNVPQIIIGNAKEFTDASGKIVYLSYEQSVKAEQLYIEEQVLKQLNIEIQLTFPASLQNELISSREKDPALAANQPNDTTAELEGKK